MVNAVGPWMNELLSLNRIRSRYRLSLVRGSHLVLKRRVSEAGMPLQIDATTRYATGNYSRPLTVSELNSASPYNTRIHKGLPPTPIDNPGLDAINAAAHPARTRYLYFVVKPCGNGASAFTSNYNQFLAFQRKYQAARAKRGGKSPTHC